MITSGIHYLMFYPYRNFSADCASVENRVVGVINNWQGKDNCQNGGERCLYKVISHRLLINPSIDI